MDILQIRYFSKVYETLNYAQAAEALMVSRQGLRKVIHNLEREVGQALFVNEANRLKCTMAAQTLYAGSRAFVRGFRELEDSVTMMKLAQEQVIYLGSTYDSDSVFTDTERKVFRSLPLEEHGLGVKVVYGRGSTSYLLGALLDGSIDYAHIVFSDLDDSLYDYRIALKGKLYVTVSEGHPLAAQQSVSMTDLEGVPISLFSRGDGVSEAVLTEARRCGVTLDVVRWDNDQRTRLDDVQEGTSATFTYRPVDSDDGVGLVSIPFENPALSWNYAVVAKKGMGDPYLMRFFAGEEVDWPWIAEQYLKEGQRDAD